MKRYLVIVFLFLLVNSCGWEDPSNVDVRTTLSSLTSSSQLSFAYFVSGETSLYTGMVMQQVVGNNGKMLDITTYNFTPTYFDNIWSICYLGVFSNLKSTIELAEKNGYGKYSGISKILMANTLATATDLWGDIPFIGNFIQDENSFQPEFDSQEELYTQIFSLLDQGIDDLTVHGDDFYPTTDDLFFGGDPDKWIRYANFLKLRYYLHLSKLQGYTNLIDNMDQPMFNSSGDALRIDFSYLNASNPVYSAIGSDFNQVKASQFFLENLVSNADPRVSFYFKKNLEGNYSAVIPGETDNLASNLSDSISGSDARITLGSYTEQMFILAEVYLMDNKPDLSLNALEEAVRSSFTDCGITNEEWMSNYISSIDISLETIINAKYSALFLQTEAWFDWRRTGYPEISSPSENSTGGIIPRRFSYPQNEIDYNPNIPLNITITDRVWWDVE